MKGNAIRQGRNRTANNLTKPQAKLKRRLKVYEAEKDARGSRKRPGSLQ